MSACSLSRHASFGAPWVLPLALGPWPIIAAVLAFILWWPLGLMALALWKGGILAGFLASRAERRAARTVRWPARSSGNAAFDEHRDAVLRRLEEERQALDAQQREFAEFLEGLKRAKDREEFDRFMANRGKPAG
jgi:Protein of unknown function (DUF2852)